MAHELEMVNGVAQMAYVGEKPWHGLGVEVPENTSASDMMALAGLDWQVKEVDTFIEWEGQKVVTNKKALVRDIDGHILTHIGENWKPVQNSEAFDFFHDFVEAGDMHMNTAGSLKDGRIIWALAKVNESFELFGGKDRVDSYLLFSNPHEYGKCIDIRFTPIRVVCNNTLTLSLGSATKNAVRINHRREFDADEVKQTMGIASSKMSKYKEMAEHLTQFRYNDTTLDEYLMTMFGTKTSKKGETEPQLTRTGNHVKELMDTQPGAEFGEGTWWQAYNAATYYYDHLAGRSADTRLDSAWFGANQKNKVKALEKALEFAV